MCFKNSESTLEICWSKNDYFTTVFTVRIVETKNGIQLFIFLEKTQWKKNTQLKVGWLVITLMLALIIVFFYIILVLLVLFTVNCDLYFQYSKFKWVSSNQKSKITWECFIPPLSSQFIRAISHSFEKYTVNHSIPFNCGNFCIRLAFP